MIAKIHKCFSGLCILLYLVGGFSSVAKAQVLTGYFEESEIVPGHIPVRSVVESPPEFGNFDESPISAQGPLLTTSEEAKPAGEPVDLQADSISHDELTQTVIASGDVFLVQDNRILRADQISYDLENDKAMASGHVVLNEASGDIHYAEEFVLEDKLKNGFVQELKTYLNDGSRFTAREGRRENGNTTIMKDASYTPCEPCKAKPEKPPVWQIVAAEVIHDETEHRVAYKHARFEVKGVPVVYTPYFSHPDGTIKRKSGFLSPSAGFKSELGAFAEGSYYWNIAPDKDATLGLMVMSKEDPLVFGQWRQRWNEAALELEGGITNSGRTEKQAGIDIDQDEEVRGHVKAEGLWDINEKWRAGVNSEWASDDQYMRQYDFSNEDILENEIYAERFSGRNYAAGRILSFQDIRVRENQVDQPEVLPEITTSFIGEPGAVPLVKGRWSLNGSLLGLEREGSEQDMNRLSLAGGWERRLVSNYGLLTSVNADIRGDFYSVRDRDVATAGSGRSKESTKARLFPNLHVQSSYPLVKDYERAQVTIAPVAAVTMVPNIDVSDDIPNEDSQDVQIDASNIFESNRFPGLDRIEDKSRVTYGMRTGIYGYGGSYGDIFLGQSYRFDDDDTPFPEGSGLDQQESDIVGQISGAYKNQYTLNYRFQLDNKTMASQRHEVDAFADWNRFRLSSRYLFAKALEGTDIDESREQAQASAAYYVTRDWRLRLGGTQDLGDDPGLRQAFTGIDYFGQCVSMSLSGIRSLTDDASGESDTEVVFRLGLKNLGEYEESSLRVDKTKE